MISYGSVRFVKSILGATITEKKCDKCKRIKEETLIIKTLKKIGYVEIYEGYLCADIVLKPETIWGSKRYFRKEERP